LKETEEKLKKTEDEKAKKESEIEILNKKITSLED
jgi:hypothetical protein